MIYIIYIYIYIHTYIVYIINRCVHIHTYIHAVPCRAMPCHNITLHYITLHYFRSQENPRQSGGMPDITLSPQGPKMAF